MFNADIKQKYIRQHSDSISVRSSLASLFNATEPYERALGKDVCEMTAEELQNMVDAITGVRFSSRKSRVSALRLYIAWCRTNGFLNADVNAINSITKQNTKKIREITVKSPFHLQSYLNTIFSPESDETSDNVLRCYLWLAYAGLPEAETMNVTASDVDLSLLVVRHEGEEYPIYREGISAFNNCIRLNSFAYIHPHYRNIQYRERKPGNQLLRLTEKTQQSVDGETNIQQFRNRIARAYMSAINAGKTTIRLSYRSAFDSGMFYRVYQIESIGGKVDYASLFDDRKTDRKQHIKEIVLAFKNDYENWKLTL